MNCCDRLLVIFSVFAIGQFILRWGRDREVISQPWQFYLQGGSEPIEVHHSAVVNFTQAAISYGTSPIKIYPDKLQTKDRHELLIYIHAKVNGPPLSFHRLDMTIDDKSVNELHFQTHLQGTDTAYAYSSIVLAPSSSLQLKYYYDDITNSQGLSKLFVHVTVHSGHYKLWDVLWSDVYKQDS